jgi:hypothetical protein
MQGFCQNNLIIAVLLAVGNFYVQRRSSNKGKKLREAILVFLIEPIARQYCMVNFEKEGGNEVIFELVTRRRATTRFQDEMVDSKLV